MNTKRNTNLPYRRFTNSWDLAPNSDSVSKPNHTTLEHWLVVVDLINTALQRGVERHRSAELFQFQRLSESLTNLVWSDLVRRLLPQWPATHCWRPNQRGGKRFLAEKGVGAWQAFGFECPLEAPPQWEAFEDRCEIQRQERTWEHKMC